MRLHACALFDTVGFCRLLESVTCSVGATAAWDDECSVTKSSANRDGFALSASDSATDTPAASDWLTGGHKCIFVRYREDRWFFTSLFSMRLMAAPIVRLRISKMLVWSEAWDAEGEKGQTRCCFKHTPIKLRAPPSPTIIIRRFATGSNTASSRSHMYRRK
jgi:hypothetical protein